MRAVFIIFLSFIYNTTYCQEINLADLQLFYSEPKSFIQNLLDKGFYVKDEKGTYFKHDDGTSISIDNERYFRDSVKLNSDSLTYTYGAKHYDYDVIQLTTDDKEIFENILSEIRKYPKQEFFFSKVWCKCYLQEYKLGNSQWALTYNFYSDLQEKQLYQIIIFDNSDFRTTIPK